MIPQDQIRKLIPHAGTMCLLESVEDWDDASITCKTTTHRRVDHPLRRNGELAALHLIEYGAQATAVHGGLLAQREGRVAAKPGMLTALRDCEFHVARIDDIEGPLTVRARKLIANAEGSMYQFEVSAGDRKLAEGRVSVMNVAA